METFIDRLKTEMFELNERISKLDDFIHSSKFLEIEPAQRTLLYAQINIMRSYNAILHQRLHYHYDDVRKRKITHG